MLDHITDLVYFVKWFLMLLGEENWHNQLAAITISYVKSAQ
jgi:hypothetical protein